MDALLITLRGTMEEWLRLRWADLRFDEARPALLLFAVLFGLTLLAWLARRGLAQRVGRAHVLLPAILPAMRRSPFTLVRHVPLVVFLLGVPFFALALADPRTGFAQEDVSAPGRRIALLVDASTSMVMRFDAPGLKPLGGSTFFAAIAAAERFVHGRMDGPYRDLIALLQFGNEAYVVTPFTTDHESVLLGLQLVGDPREWVRFSDWGTTIIEGLDQTIALFKSFNFDSASGNLMIVFTDGRDTELDRMGRPLDALVAEARRVRVPIYMIRTAHQMPAGRLPQDAIWRTLVERTGGRFYAASDEATLVQALEDIDRLAPGRVEIRHYSVQRPRYPGYVLVAAACWIVAATLKLGFRTFRTFP